MSLKSKNKRKKHRELKEIDISLSNTYGQWKPMEDMYRSFFIWTGRYSGSGKEKEIYAILKSHNLRFFCEVSFDLKKRFDFYIPLLDLVIEYDGKQHFEDLKELNNDIGKESLLRKLGVRLIRYNKTHDLSKQIAHDLIYHPVLNS